MEFRKGQWGLVGSRVARCRTVGEFVSQYKIEIEIEERAMNKNGRVLRLVCGDGNEVECRFTRQSITPSPDPPPDSNIPIL